MKEQDHLSHTREGSDRVVTAGPDETTAAAAKRMCAHKIGCLVVVDQAGKIAGILTERDIINSVVSPALDPAGTIIANVMTTEVASCPADASLAKAQEVMTRLGIRHLPLADNGVAVKMISAREIMAWQVTRNKAMKSAAEQVARLCTSLKSLDFDEVRDMIAREVPRVFTAGRSVLCLCGAEPCPGKSFRADRWKCLCPERDLRHRPEARKALEKNGILLGPAPRACVKLGCRSPSIVIALGESGQPMDGAKNVDSTPSYLCMCDMNASAAASEEMVYYKGTLLREILSTNLVNARLYQEVKERSVTDALTGVGTRRLLDEKLEDECTRSARYKRPFCLAIVDVDHFKLINDRMGHTGGDKVLMGIGERLSQEKRTTDVLARYGGDEFILLMPETRLDQAVIVLERMRSRIERIPLPGGLSVTISCGIAEHNAPPQVSESELVRRSDIALYQAKEAGRNRVECWDRIPSSLKHAHFLDDERVKDMKGRVASLLFKSKEIFIQSIWGLARALEARDPYTRSHSENVARYSVGIAETLGTGAEEIDLIRRAALIHDIGKIGVPDAILGKPGDLSDEERLIVEQHPLIAVQILDQMRFLEREIPIVRHHHEHWDGQGYPDGISRALIEPGARILAVADAFDAITSPRSYRDAKPLSEAMRALIKGARSQFDPDTVDGMVRWADKIGRELGKQGQATPKDLLDSQQACQLVA